MVDASQRKCYLSDRTQELRLELLSVNLGYASGTAGFFLLFGAPFFNPGIGSGLPTTHRALVLLQTTLGHHLSGLR